MNKKTIIHGITIAAIVIATFVLALTSPARINAATSDNGIVNIAKVDFETRTHTTGGTLIGDNMIPLAEAPYETDASVPFGWLIVAGAALITTFVIREEHKDRTH